MVRLFLWPVKWLIGIFVAKFRRGVLDWSVFWWLECWGWNNEFCSISWLNSRFGSVFEEFLKFWSWMPGEFPVWTGLPFLVKVIKEGKYKLVPQYHDIVCLCLGLCESLIHSVVVTVVLWRTTIFFVLFSQDVPYWPKYLLGDGDIFLVPQCRVYLHYCLALWKSIFFLGSAHHVYNTFQEGTDGIDDRRQNMEGKVILCTG